MSSQHDTVFFTHVMKTGGTSVSTTLRTHFGAERSFPYPYGDRRNGGPPATAKVMSNVLVDLAPGDRTVSHLRQLVAGNERFSSLTEAYDDPVIRDRLTNLQCQIFAEPGGREPDITLDLSDPEVLAEFREHTAIVWATSIGIPLVVGPQELDDALERLDRYDVVGVTEQLGSFSALIEQRTGISMPPVGQYNVTTDAEPVPDALLDRIAADTAFDRRLYEHACQRADASPAE